MPNGGDTLSQNAKRIKIVLTLPSVRTFERRLRSSSRGSTFQIRGGSW